MPSFLGNFHLMRVLSGKIRIIIYTEAISEFRRGGGGDPRTLDKSSAKRIIDNSTIVKYFLNITKYIFLNTYSCNILKY